MSSPNKKTHYVNNAQLLVAMTEYREKYLQTIREGKDPPRASEYIGASIMKIATHLAYKPNFANYSFRDEMISDGIENCLQYLHNFDPAKSSNPFAYFTQIIYYAFIRRIQREKKNLYTKHVLTQLAEVTNGMSETHESETGKTYGGSAQRSEWSQEQMDRFVDEFESKRRRGSRKRIDDQ